MSNNDFPTGDTPLSEVNDWFNSHAGRSAINTQMSNYTKIDPVTGVLKADHTFATIDTLPVLSEIDGALKNRLPYYAEFRTALHDAALVAGEDDLSLKHLLKMGKDYISRFRASTADDPDGSIGQIHDNPLGDQGITAPHFQTGPVDYDGQHASANSIA